MKTSGFWTWAALLTLYLLWGSTYLAIRLTLDGLSPFVMGAVRFCLSGGLLFILARASRQRPPGAREVGWAGLVGIFTILAANGTVIWAEQFIASGLTALLVASLPIWILLIDRGLLQRRRPAALEVLGALLGLLGVACLVAPDLAAHALQDSWAEVAVLLGTLANAAGILMARRVSLPRSGLYQSACSQVATGVGFMAIAWLGGGWQGTHWSQVPLHSWMALGYLVVFGAIVGYSIYFWLIRHVAPGLVATYALVNPVVALILGGLFLAEPLGDWDLAGTVAVLLSVAMVILGQQLPRQGSEA